MLGSCRKIDPLGRVTIPKELRRKYGISDKTLLSISELDDKIVIQKAVPACKLCGSEQDVDEHLMVCAVCSIRIKNN
ncbi:MAG: AbrB/MazE/SpoVT family DNA-binding domain-containing protein [Eubacteriales bacterium]|nr:AbrB/MazE/SpoVT family DNA-binding domain-containing protein [Eubacteriales bacterium]